MRRKRCFGWPQHRALMALITPWACTSIAKVLIKTALKRCGGTSLLPHKDILQHCTLLLSVTSEVKVLLQTWRKPFAGTGAPKQRVTLELHPL